MLASILNILYLSSEFLEREKKLYFDLFFLILCEYFFLYSKLLKEHESKYEPLGHDETFKIMEEILAMQIGLNTEQVCFLYF